MILFFVNNENSKARLIYELIKKETNIPVNWISMENLIKNGNFFIENTKDDLNAVIKTCDCNEEIKSKDVKIIYFNQNPYIDKNWLPYEKEYDIFYAQSEWWASLIAMFLSQKHIKFINPVQGKYDLNSELEQLMILQKFNIQTIDMVLTNNPKTAFYYYNFWDRNILFKSVCSGYIGASPMEIPDLARLNKLKLSPAIFQKIIEGTEINICLIGKKILAMELFFKDNEDVPQFKNISTDDIPYELKEKLIKISEYIETPLIQFQFLRKQDQYYAISMNIHSNFEMNYEFYGQSYVQALKNYLIEEYNQ